MRMQDAVELILLGAIWGASFLFMRSATPEFGAISLVIVRTGIAALCLLPLLIMSKNLLVVRQQWKTIFFVGLTNTAIPFCLFAYSTVHLGAGLASILNATAPMFGAIVAYFWLKDNLPATAVAGLVIGFFGVVVISVSRTGVELSLAILPVLAALAATCLYGIAACFTKQYLSGINTLAIATGSQIFATIILLPLAFLSWPDTNPSYNAWMQVITLGVVCTGVAYILYFRLIANLGAAKAITVAYLVPVFGVFWGVIFLGEIVTPLMITGASLILLGVSLTTGVIKWRNRIKTV